MRISSEVQSFEKLNLLMVDIRVSTRMKTENIVTIMRIIDSARMTGDLLNGVSCSRGKSISTMAHFDVVKFAGCDSRFEHHGSHLITGWLRVIRFRPGASST